jgi:hypothetical protein
MTDYKYARDYDPRDSKGARKVQQEAADIGRTMADAHIPYSIVEDRNELRELADTQCQRWWSSLENTSYHKEKYPEVWRLYVASFTKAYTDKVKDHERVEEEHKAARAQYEAEERERRRWQAEHEEQERIEAERREAEYREQQRELAKLEAERKRRRAEVERGIVVEITGHHFTAKGMQYSVEFLDPFRMTKPVTFGITVGDDGVVEIEEVQQPEEV